nr:15503_t:CDS:2 [Entrophospora candida]
MIKVLVIGSINIDDYFQVPHIIQSGETLTSSKYDQKAGGKGANQAVALAKAGAIVWHLGKIGKDGLVIRDYMSKQGVNVEHIIVTEDQPTGRAIIQLSETTHDNAIILLPGTNHMITLKEIEDILKLGNFKKSDIVVMQNEIGPVGGEILRVCKQKELITVFNPAPFSTNIMDVFPFDNIDCLILNKIESCELYSKIRKSKDSISLKNRNEEKDLLFTIKNKFPQLKILIVTLGDKGLLAWFKQINDDNLMTFTNYELTTPVLDTTGAGDTFIGFFVASLSRNLWAARNFEEPRTPPKTSLDYLSIEQIVEGIMEGMIAASLSVRKLGAMDSIPYLHEVYQEKSKR